MRKKAIIAVSGGVDSAVAALLMREKGYDCEGLMMKVAEDDGGEFDKNARDAESICRALDIPFRTVDLSEAFEKYVIRTFVDTYRAGRTPNPCVNCNKHLKFGLLADEAKKRGADLLVTGHYALVTYDENTRRHGLKKGIDAAKDQSYMLYHLSQEQLKNVYFPLGNYEKSEIRRIAAACGFVNADRKDSQDICFLPQGDYAGFIEKYTGIQFEAGDFVDMQGKIRGRHKGLIHYTPGQRKGLGISSAEPLYVVRLDVPSNTVVLGREEDLYTGTLYAEDISFMPFDKMRQPMRVKAKIRYRQTAEDATAEQVGRDRIKVTFDKKQRAVSAGQAVVLYENDNIIGGGTIVP